MIDVEKACLLAAACLVRSMTITLTHPAGEKPPKGFPRGELLSIGTDGCRNVAYDPLKILTWVQRETVRMDTIEK